MSTNKVYGDRPNHPAAELRPAGLQRSRWGVWTLPVDQSTCSWPQAGVRRAERESPLFRHRPAPARRLHHRPEPRRRRTRLPSYLVKCGLSRAVNVFRPRKQVRDNIHAEDVAAFAHAFWKAPRVAESGFAIGELYWSRAFVCRLLTHVRRCIPTSTIAARRHICITATRKIRPLSGLGGRKSLTDTVRNRRDLEHAQPPDENPDHRPYGLSAASWRSASSGAFRARMAGSIISAGREANDAAAPQSGRHQRQAWRRRCAGDLRRSATPTGSSMRRQTPASAGVDGRSAARSSSTTSQAR